ANNRAADDFSRVIEVEKAFSLFGTNLDIQTRQLLDLDEWLRTFAYESLLGVSDAYFTGANRHNFRMYVRPGDNKVMAMPWDWDSSFKKAADASLVGNDNLSRIVSLPNNLRVFYGHLFDIVSTSFNTAYTARWTQHYGSLANQDFSGILNYIGARAAFVLSQLPTSTPFAITSNSGNNFSTNQSPVTLAGTAPIQVKSIQINGAPYLLTWTTLTNWSVLLPLNAGTNSIVVQGLDAAGAVVSNATQNITINNTGFGALLPVIINEWMADNAAPNGFIDPADGTYQDWFELFNPNSTAVDLSGFYLTDNLSEPTKWQIPANTIMGEKSFRLVWADGKTNLNGLGTNGDLHANFSLAKGGEAIGLFGTNGVTPQSAVIFGAQRENVSQGFFPDGNTNHAFVMMSPTPRTANVLPALQFGNVSVADGMLNVEWAAIPEESYRLQYKTNLTDATWLDLGFEMMATNSLVRFTNSAATNPQGFYRVLRVE
ncbi:MAG: lamin tail domain-containing protein, partial [Verrucomicrobiota bacterium]